MSIPLKGFVFLGAAVFTIFSGMIGLIYFLGVWTSLKFEWMTPAMPYLRAFTVCAVLLWLTALVMDYIVVRRAAFAKPLSNPASVDPGPLIRAEEKKRADAIEAIYTDLWKQVGEINRSINDLKPKPESTLKQRTIQLANELFVLLQQHNPEPPDPLSDKVDRTNSNAITAYCNWQKKLFYDYMARFRTRVIQIDDELAAREILTKLDYSEIDPPGFKCEVDVKKIAEALLLTANNMQN